MKKLIIAAVGGLLATSCSLDIVPENTVTYTNAFATESELNTTTASIQYFINIYLPDNTTLFSAGAKADYSLKNEEVREWNPRRVIQSAEAETGWKGMYDIIYESNLLLDNIHRTQGLTQDRYNFHTGQAYFAMGLAYFTLAQRYGNCVITNNSSDIVVYKLSPMIDVINKAISCAEKAYEVLPTYDKLTGLNGSKISSKQYASKGNSAALLSQLYAWKGSMIDLYGPQGENAMEAYKKSIDYATAIIDKKVGDYSLCSSPEELCAKLSNPDVENPEAIFTLTFDKARSTESVTPNKPASFYLSWPVDDTRDLGNLPYETDFQLYKETVDAMYPESTDKRRAAFFYKIDEPHDVDGMDYAILYKFRNSLYVTDVNSPSGKYFRSINADYVYWRLADIILLRAECYAKTGQTAQAETDLNTIRQRAGASPYPSEYDNGDLKKAIFKERERELIGETDERYYDVIRNNYVKEELLGKFQKLTQTDIKNGALFLPIPASAYSDKDGMTTNTQIRQTTYWIPYM